MRTPALPMVDGSLTGHRGPLVGWRPGPFGELWRVRTFISGTLPRRRSFVTGAELYLKFIQILPSLYRLCIDFAITPSEARR
jgi:hypothetical protein